MGTLSRGALGMSALVTMFVVACGNAQESANSAPAVTPVAGASAPSAAASPNTLPASAAPSSTQPTLPATPSAAASSNTKPASAATPAAASGAMPCGVRNALAAACQKCHGASPTFGAPMPLVSAADFQRASPSDAATPVYKVAMARMNDAMRPMPPASAISPTDKQTLTDWLASGAVANAPSDVVCEQVKPADGAPLVHDEAYFKNGITPDPGETCYELTTHGGQTEGDTSKFDVRQGEFYEQFYFRVPWTENEVMTRFGAKYDNLKVLHHWLLFTSSKDVSQIGRHEGTSGSTIGDTSQLIAGWAVGGDHTQFPKDTGLELTTKGILNIQWHYYNAGDKVEPDATHVQVCTVPKSMRKNIGSLTFLGSEDFNGPLGMPAKTKSDFGGACVNDSGAPITIFGFTPHMHKFGINMRAVIMRKNGMMEEVFNKPFDFNSQISYVLPTAIQLEAGESIVSTCTFNNTSAANVPFGPSSDQEMCYNFTMSYPARALDNGVPSLIGATNTCW